MELLRGGSIARRLLSLARNCRRNFKLVSPWITADALRELLENLSPNVEIEVILRVSSPEDLTVTTPEVFKLLEKRGAKLYLSKTLHAKFFIFDDRRAVLGSANLTSKGISLSAEPNEEVAIYTESLKTVTDLLKAFKELSANSFRLAEKVVGFVVPPSDNTSMRALVLENTSTGEFLQTSDGKLLCRVESVRTLPPRDFELPPFESPYTSAAKMFAHLVGKTVREATLKPVLTGTILPPEMAPLVKTTSDLGGSLKRKADGSPMEKPLKIGKLKGGKAPVYLDAEALLSGHLLITGVTGSGKSHFAKRLISRLPNGYRVLVLDPYGEYFNDLLNFGVPEGDIDHVEFPDTLMFAYGEELVEFLTVHGFGNLFSGRRSGGRENLDLIGRCVKPLPDRNCLSELKLKELLLRLKPSGEEVVEYLAEVFGREVLKNQPSVLRKLKEAFRKEGLKIFNLRGITDSTARASIAGMVMLTAFRKQLADASTPTLMVLEEAHEFAPERGYGEVPSSRTNLSYNLAKKIAAEGRKLKLGLVVVTQRTAQVTKYVLAQMGTVAAFRTVNDNDVSALESYFQYAERELLKVLPSLRTGECLLGGTALPFTAVATID